jgi:hypothetical protein
VGKSLAVKPIAIEGIHQTLGKIWCGDKGLVIKDVGENKFLFSFNHPMGKKRVLEDEPWMTGHSLLVMVAFNGKKALEAVDFHHVLIWIRVSKLPMWMMNRKVAEIIGNDVGEFMDIDDEENGTAVGRYLRVKVRIDIRRPLMCGVTMEEEGSDAGRWCPFEYEFLLKFCHCCGIIGHTDRVYTMANPTSTKQYGSWLCALPSKWCFSSEMGTASSGGHRVVHNQVEHSKGDWRKEKLKNQMVAIGRKEDITTIPEQTEKVIYQKHSFELTEKEDVTDAPQTEDPSSLEHKGESKGTWVQFDVVHGTVAQNNVVQDIVTGSQVENATSEVSAGVRKTGTFRRLRRNVEKYEASSAKAVGRKRGNVITADAEHTKKKNKADTMVEARDVQMVERSVGDDVEESAANSVVGLSDQPCRAQ